jgi:hypothetical protein
LTVGLFHVKLFNTSGLQDFGQGLATESLIDYLSKYADQLESELGAPDPEIRAKIAELKVANIIRLALDPTQLHLTASDLAAINNE